MERAAKSAQVVFSIEDLLSKILSFLPVKDLLRFKSVSKHWWALISDPNFCHLCSPNPNPAAGIFLQAVGGCLSGGCLSEYVPFSSLNSRTFQLNFSGHISQSCNGLLLVESCNSYLVCNPTTNCCSKLPEPDGGRGFYKCIMTLVFDPVISRHYNVVFIRLLQPGYKQLEFQIYSSETRSWGVCRDPFPATVNFDPDTVDFEDGVHWNGAVHWLGVVEDEGGFYFKVERQVLEKMPIMPFRQYGRTYGYKHYFGHSCDHLHLIEKPHFKNTFDVYEMRRDYSEWFVKYRVDLLPVIAATKEMDFNFGNLDYRFRYRVLNVIRGEAEEDVFLVVMTYNKIIRYNLVSGTFENLYQFKKWRCLEWRGVEYIESLCCV